VHRCALLLLLCATGLTAAGSSSISAARCRQSFKAGSSSQFVGRAAWEDQADRTIVGSTEDRTVGRALLTCEITFDSPLAGAVLDFGGAHVTFTRSGDAGTGSGDAGGLEIRAPGCRLSGLRTSRESWIQLGPARYALSFTSAVKRVVVTFELVDSSKSGAVRADINTTSIRPVRPGEPTLACPPAAP
jgi:hypothetical protein